MDEIPREPPITDKSQLPQPRSGLAPPGFRLAAPGRNDRDGLGWYNRRLESVRFSAVECYGTAVASLIVSAFPSPAAVFDWSLTKPRRVGD